MSTTTAPFTKCSSLLEYCSPRGGIGSHDLTFILTADPQQKFAKDQLSRWIEKFRNISRREFNPDLVEIEVISPLCLTMGITDSVVCHEIPEGFCFGEHLLRITLQMNIKEIPAGKFLAIREESQNILFKMRREEMTLSEEDVSRIKEALEELLLILEDLAGILLV